MKKVYSSTPAIDIHDTARLSALVTRLIVAARMPRYRRLLWPDPSFVSVMTLLLIRGHIAHELCRRGVAVPPLPHPSMPNRRTNTRSTP